MSANSCSMDYRPFFHPDILAAKDTTPDLLGSEEEDSDLYAELWRQILRLTSDEEDNRFGSTNQSACRVAAPAPSPVSCSGRQMNTGNINPSPVWWLNPPRSGSGTGVFIPSIAATERGGRGVRTVRKKKKAAKKRVENK